MNDWIPLIVAAIAAATAVSGYSLNNSINRRIEKARYYAEALNAVEKYGALPYIFRRRHDSSKETRAELARMLTDIQATLRFYQGWLELDSPAVGAAYNGLVAKMRQKSSDYRKQALSSPPAEEDKDIEITPYDYNAKAEQDHCLAVMRQELKLFKWLSRHRLRPTNRQVMQDYFDTLVKRGDFPSYFTDDVVASFEGTDQQGVGRDAAAQVIRYVHENAFDARMELKNLLADEGKAAIEADFVGTHTGEFAGIQPTGRAVRVPYSVVYDLRGDQISALRIYFPMSLLVEQLTN